MSAKFPRLLEPVRIRNVTIRNRIVSTAHGTFMSSQGLPNDRIRAYHEARAKGGTGLIICEAASVHKTAIGAGHYADAVTDACIVPYRKIAKAVRRHGAAVFGQLYHPGRGDIAGSTDDGTISIAYAPSALPCEHLLLMPRPMSRALIHEVVASYGDAARRMVEAGLQGIEVMAHHGHLVSQFLNPRTNLRQDEYGGPIGNRLRFLVEILADVRAKIGDEPPIGLRISSDEMDDEGIKPEESLAVVTEIERLGLVDYVSVSAGSASSIRGFVHAIAPMAIAPGHIASYAAAIKEQVSLPVIATGRINEPYIAEKIIAEGNADLCGMTRAQICDPELANKIQAGQTDDIRACIACNQACIGHGSKGAAISCIQYPESGRELEFLPRRPVITVRRIMVVGAGPAGMKAAAVAAERGHEVTLYERSGQLGGQVLLAQQLPGRAEFGGLATNLAREVECAGVEVRTRTEITGAEIEDQAPDAIIVATGAKSWRPDLPVEDDAHIVDAWQVVQDEVNVGTSVVIADAMLDWTGMGLAEKLARAGCLVRLCVIGDIPGQSLPSGVRGHWAGVLHSLGVRVLPLLRLAYCGKDAVGFIHTCSGEPVIEEEVDTLVLVQGRTQDSNLEEALENYEGPVRQIGDCVAPRTAEEAVLEGLRAGHDAFA